MSDEVVEILQALVKARGKDCLVKADTWRMVSDYASRAEETTKRKVVMSFKSGAFVGFSSSSDYDMAVRKLMDYNFWSEELANDVASSFCIALGVDVESLKPADPIIAGAEPVAKHKGNSQFKCNSKIQSDFVFVEWSPRLGSKGFYICDHQVTQDEYFRIMAANPSRFSGKDNSVENVRWYDCTEYCNLRSRQEGLEECYSGSGGVEHCSVSYRYDCGPSDTDGNLGFQLARSVRE